MNLLSLILVFLIFNLIFSYILIIIPIIFFDNCRSLFWSLLGISCLIIFAWFFGE